MKPIEHSVHSLEALWNTEPSFTIAESRDLICELVTYDWLVYISLYTQNVESLSERFMKYHATTPGVILDTLTVGIPVGVGQYRDSGNTHKFALYNNGLVWQACRQDMSVAYTVLAIDQQTADRWSYPASYINIKTMLQQLLTKDQ